MSDAAIPMNPILAIDPGCTESQYLVLVHNGVLEHALLPNDAMMDAIPRLVKAHRPRACIEGIQSFGMLVGQEVFDTAWWGGRFDQQCRASGTIPAIVFRKAVKMAICGHPHAKDPNIRQALIDRFGGKDKAIGRKATPGPLHGISSHAWAALALAITFADTAPQIAKETA